MLPLVLGFHQFVEAFVWLSLQGHINATLGKVAMWIYASIAFVVLPMFVPLSVFLLEGEPRRKRIMAPFVALGIAVAIVLLIAMIRGPLSVELRPYHLAYNLGIHHALLIVTLYVVAVCGAWLLSSHRPVAFYGVINLAAVIVIAKLTVDGFASVWCGYAALTSGAIAVYMRMPRRASSPSHVIA